MNSMVESNKESKVFADLLAELMTRQDKGETINLKAIIEKYPEFESAFTEYFAAVESIDGLSEPVDESFKNTIVSVESGTVTGETSKEQPTEGAFAAKKFPFMFGRYEMLRLLGKGGMGKVYLAKDSILGRKVALKIPEIPAGNDDYVKRFYREARAAAAIQHRNICPVFDIGELDETRFISMAYIEGKPLSEFVGKMNPREVAVVVRKMAIALHEAHKLGIVHRDLKPANVMIDKQNEPVIMDFGLARDVSLSDATQLTQAGTIVGTPSYMSPEQIRDTDNVTALSDVYSLGVIMYLMLTGKLPFEGDLFSIITQIASDNPSRPIEVCEEIDPVIDAICLVAMSKVASDRFSSMIDLSNALNDYLEQKSTQTDGDDHNREAISSPPTSTTNSNAAVDEPNSVSASERHDSAFEVKIETEQDRPKFKPKAKPQSKPRPKPKSFFKQNKPALWISAAIALAIVGILLSVVFLIPSKNGYIRVEIDDPSISAELSSNGMTINSTNKSESIKIEPGESQSLKITRGNFEFETEDFVLRRGEKSVLKINFVKGNLIATRDGNAIDVERKNKPHVALKPLGKDPTKKTITNPDASSKTNASIAIGPQSTNREIAAWILSNRGGTITISTNRKRLHCRSVDELPESNFKTLEAVLPPTFVDEDLRHVAKLKYLEVLKVGNQLKGPGFEYFADSKLIKLDCAVGGGAKSNLKLAYIAKISNLQELSLTYGLLSGQLGKLKPLRNLKILYTWSTRLEPGDVDDLAVLSQLEDISWSGNLDDQSPKTFVDSFPNLRRLRCNGTDVSDASVFEFAKLKSLESLSISNSRVTPDAAQRLKSLMPNCRLDFVPTRMEFIKRMLANDAKFVAADGSLIKDSANFTNIEIKHLQDLDHRFGDNELKMVFQFLPHLKNFRIEGTNVTVEGLKGFKDRSVEKVVLSLNFTGENAKHLLVFNKAKELGIVHSSLDNKSLQCLSKLDQLEILSLAFSSSLGDELRVLADLPKLVDLDLTGTVVSPSNLEWIKESSKLDSLNLSYCKNIDSLSFLTNCKSLSNVKMVGLDVDLTPLESTAIKHVIIDYVPEKHEKVLRNMKSLEMVNHTPISKFFSKPAQSK